MKGQFEKAGIKPKVIGNSGLKILMLIEVGQEIKVEDMFRKATKLMYQDIKRQKGYQGTVKRFGTSRGRESHSSQYHRGVSSMGGASNQPGF